MTMHGKIATDEIQSISADSECDISDAWRDYVDPTDEEDGKTAFFKHSTIDGWDGQGHCDVIACTLVGLRIDGDCGTVYRRRQFAIDTLGSEVVDEIERLQSEAMQ